MYDFRTRDGKEARITKGCAIIWSPEARTIQITTIYGDGTPGFVWSGDDKRIVNFIRNVQDFEDFAIILGEIHGLHTNIRRKDSDVVTIEFV